MIVRGGARAVTRLGAMGRRLQISLLAPFAALALVGCGSGDDGTIPEQSGNDLLTLLETLQNDVNGGDCETIPGLADQLQAEIQALPSDVDPEVKTELLDAAANLETLSVDPPECVESGATGETGLEPSTAEDPATPETPTEPIPEEPAPEEEPAPPEEDTQAPAEEPQGDQGGQGGGGGSSGSGGPSESGGITGEFEK